MDEDPEIVDIVSTGLQAPGETRRLRIPPQRPPAKRLRVAYRVELEVLKRQSKYFSNLFNSGFTEANIVADAFRAMSMDNKKASDLAAKDLPWIRIHDDDEATKAAGREAVFAELLRILHGKETTKTAKTPPTLRELAILAVFADRFACARPVSAYVRGLRFRFPQAQVRATGEDGAVPRLGNEESIRSKILIAWFLDLPLVFASGTRELILAGSSRWSPYAEQDEAPSTAAWWWDLPDGLEGELQTRRDCILSCIASVQRHFLSLYTSRTRQCKLGYESSASCDSFQLGEMVKFLASKDLLFLGDFSPDSPGSVRGQSALDIHHLLATLKQCPSYQINQHHTNCGLRLRILGILDYIQVMLSANAVVGIATKSWRADRAAASWVAGSEEDDRGEEGDRAVFRFTRAVAGDPSLRLEGSLGVDRMARQLFTARDWDWTPEI